MRNYLSECLGSFALLFCGTGAIIINGLSGGAITHPGVALSFGLIVFLMIEALGDVSGAHMNPAVTLSFAVGGRFPWKEVPPYVLAQTTGAIAASALLRALFPSHPTLGATIPAGSAAQSFVLEVLLSFLLMLVILRVAFGSKERGLRAGITIGATVGLEALFAGPVCGASMNPIRSLAPALVSGHSEHLWIYILAPVSGMLLALPAFHLLQPTSHDHSPLQ
ncbi:MAG: aquaporin [Chitinophagaceae bacterium]|nr:MAG: aquaporin [Chitinophagaceae bacterium]